MEHILKASYGEARQRQANLKAPDKRDAARILREFKERKKALPEQEVPPPAKARDYRPPFWDSKLYGKPFGDFNSPPALSLAKQLQGVVANTAGLALHHPGSPKAGKAAAAAPLPFQQPTKALARDVVQMEDQMRRALKTASSVNRAEKTVLLASFAKVLGVRGTDVAQDAKVSVQQFIATWKALGVPVSTSEAAAFFNKYGQDAQGRLPVMVFADALLVGAARLLMMGNSVQKGAYKAGKPATHMGKILYPECKKGVFPPSDWDPQLAVRSAHLPDIGLQLEFIYGYAGHYSTASNLFYTSTGEVAYFAAAVGIVYDMNAHMQRFFLGHDDDICCMDIAPNKRMVCTGQVGKNPCAVVWDTKTLKELGRLAHGCGYRGIQACAFSSSGTKVVTIATDNNHSMFIWDWAKDTGKPLVLVNTQQGAPPAVYGVRWSHFQTDRIVTYGQNHIRFWTVQRSKAPGSVTTMTASSQSGQYGKEATHSIWSACFLPTGLVLTGGPEGQICVWKGDKLVRCVPGHAKGPLVHRPDGPPTYGGVRCLRLREDLKTLLSGGADGHVLVWDVSSGDLGAQLQMVPMVLASQVGEVTPPALRALDCRPGSDQFIAGTAAGDIWEVDNEPSILIWGHESSLLALATNPVYPHIYATISDSDKVVVWDANTRKIVRLLSVGMKAGCATFSPDGQHLAVGMQGGGIKILEFHPATRQVWWCKPFKLAVDELRYSPNGRYLAAASHEQVIDVFDVKQGYKKVTRCHGHSSAIRHLDWSADSTVLQSNDQAYEVLCFDAQTGKAAGDNQRDTVWASWTCVLGFAVMGIWPRDSDGTDVNACDRSPSQQYLATADDFGMVKLFHYPCVVQHAPCHPYRGHSSHVTNVRWTADEKRLVSTGGIDRTIMQWRVRPKEKPADPHVVTAPWEAKDGITYAPPKVEAAAGTAGSQQRLSQRSSLVLY
ncbi:hypothetical protein WJX72_000919 [[Myrmecia] bisecta]|uniref:Uncharacterized protein n=1 Tax=[Myrmecia] bisecta TaxID=41462 RepID=A0AAW1Q724_9CHLO